MKRKFLILFLCVISVNLFAQISFIPELIQRDGLPNLALKIKAAGQDSICIAFFGGSITEAKDGWRDQSMAWLNKQYPKAKFKQINAAIGGTGSSLGVYRLSEQVLKYKPDLIFVEFGVNDYKETHKSILESMEGIVRQTWKADSKTDICFIYTIAIGMLDSYQKGFFPNSVNTMEEIASHYKIPSLNFAPNILTKVEKKELNIQGKQGKNDSVYFSPDGVHPYPETGQLYYTQTLSSYFPELIKRPKKLNHKLKQIHYSDAYENAAMIDVSETMLVNASKTKHVESAEYQKFTRLLPQLKALRTEQESLQFDFTGNKIGFLDVIGPESTQLKVEVDNEAPRYITRFDRFGTFSRMHWFFVENLSDGKHHIKISISPNKINKAAILGVKPTELESSKKYDKELWRVGKILLVNKGTHQ
ncbi:MAG TPA: SGNH/GDSL hydrolase family protein [Pedobacter sp.]|jgi:lysophospholipase L1-like esterase